MKEKNVKNHLQLFVSEWGVWETRGTSIDATYVYWASTTCQALYQELGDKEVRSVLWSVVQKKRF